MADYLDLNRSAWTGYAGKYLEPGRRDWGADPAWGIWSIPEVETWGKSLKETDSGN